MPGRDWDLDEEDVPVRPARRSRPRTKIRPKHEHARTGFVTAVDRGRYTCLVDGTAVSAMKARELGKQSIVVGDRAFLVGDLSGREGTLARVVRIAERHGELRRSADDESATERVVVANVDQLVIVASLIDPPLRYGFVDRCLVAAYDAGVAPVLCLTKSDLGPELIAEAESYYSQLDLTMVTMRPGASLDELTDLLADKENVFFGHSGVGKSTLINRLVPGADRATAEVRSIGKGSHTSTSTVALQLPGGGWVIDTPACARSGWPTSPPTRSSRRSPSSSGSPPSAPGVARTRPRSATAPSTPRSAPTTRWPAAWRRSAACWPRWQRPRTVIK
ncbi:ribosome small subunit-dependent GTPase A [Glycomyces albus]